MSTQPLSSDAWSTYGEVFTQAWVVDAILDLVGYTTDADLAKRVIVEPSCGSGAFLVVIVERLLTSARAKNTPFNRLSGCIRAYDVRADNVDWSRKAAAELLLAAGCPKRTADALTSRWVRQTDFLLDEEAVEADFAVGNPPYIRLEELDPVLVRQYRSRWTSMRGRADIYIGFIERMLQLAKPGGRVGIICADRWMRNEYGERLRRLIASGYAVDHVWSLHDVDAFEAAVSAYPAITVLRRGQQGPVAVADTTAAFGAEASIKLTKWALGRQATIDYSGFRGFRATAWPTAGDPWPAGSVERLKTLSWIQQNFPAIEDSETGTVLSIGVATGADRVYITNDTSVVEPSRLLPLAMTEDIATGELAWSGHYVVNPWDDDGLVDLHRYPQLAAYLNQHSATIRRRHVAQKAPAKWYRTIDRVRTGLADRPKLLIPDLKATIHPVLDPGGLYPHHNVYYVVSDTWDLEVLGGILLSRVAQAFIEAYCVRMRGGTLRFQAQYLRKIRVPRPEDLAPAVERALRTAFRRRDVEAATRAALRAYGLDHLPD